LKDSTDLLVNFIEKLYKKNKIENQNKTKQKQKTKNKKQSYKTMVKD